MEKKSSIIAIGLTIHNTPVEIREKLAIPEVGPQSDKPILQHILHDCTRCCSIAASQCSD